MNNVVLKGKLGAGFNDDRYTLPKDGNPGDILVKTETGSAWQKQEPATSTPDWNQNDPTASDYIKNRPCYRTLEKISLLNEGVFNFNAEEGIFVSYLERPINIAAGNKCFISWDGVEYECVSGDGYVGNLAIFGGVEDTGEPFIIDENVIGTLDTSQSHVIKFDMLTYNYSKLAAEYVENGRLLKNIVYHDRPDITLDEAKKYQKLNDDILLKWDGEWFDNISISIVNNNTTYMTARNSIAHTQTTIPMNGDGVFLKKNCSDAQVYIRNSPSSSGGTVSLELNKQRTSIRSSFIGPYSTTDVLFVVKKNGTKNGQDFEVLGDGSIKTNYVIIGSSTPNSTKKFKITVDDTGAISATEVT